MSTFSDGGRTASLFMFNDIIAQFDVPKKTVTDHGYYFCNKMMTQLSSMLGFHQENSSPYYPQSNGKVEVINHVLKMIIQLMVGTYKLNWHLILFLVLSAY